MSRYNEYAGIKSNPWETVIYFSDEVFDAENYKEKSIKRESKIAFSEAGYEN